jgi:hypothetical protein
MAKTNQCDYSNLEKAIDCVGLSKETNLKRFMEQVTSIFKRSYIDNHKASENPTFLKHLQNSVDKAFNLIHIKPYGWISPEPNRLIVNKTFSYYGFENTSLHPLDYDIVCFMPDKPPFSILKLILKCNGLPSRGRHKEFSVTTAEIIIKCQELGITKLGWIDLTCAVYRKDRYELSPEEKANVDEQLQNQHRQAYGGKSRRKKSKKHQKQRKSRRSTIRKPKKTINHVP